MIPSYPFPIGLLFDGVQPVTPPAEPVNACAPAPEPRPSVLVMTYTTEHTIKVPLSTHTDRDGTLVTDACATSRAVREAVEWMGGQPHVDPYSIRFRLEHPE